MRTTMATNRTTVTMAEIAGKVQNIMEGWVGWWGMGTVEGGRAGEGAGGQRVQGGGQGQD